MRRIVTGCPSKAEIMRLAPLKRIRIVQLFGYDLDGNLVLRAAGPRNALDPTGYGFIYSYLTDHMLWCFGGVVYSGYWRQCECLGSFRTGTRTVLGAEVEKTNLTGMRLTYTFTFS